MSEISIVVPVYKGIRFLREALDSVKAQTFTDWECLCVDDGSKDGSGALLDEIAATDPRIRVFHRENGGTSVARNFALSQAKGKAAVSLVQDVTFEVAADAPVLPKVAVIVPAYDAEAFLPQCLDSLLAQSMPVEIFCCDDGSTDGTGRILDDYAASRQGAANSRLELKGLV